MSNKSVTKQLAQKDYQNLRVLFFFSFQPLAVQQWDIGVNWDAVNGFSSSLLEVLSKIEDLRH